MAKEAFKEKTSLTKLFPNINFNDIKPDSAYSTFGPAAYFVELMKIANNHIEPDSQHSELSLKKRRPDLWKLQLNQANCDSQRPYLLAVVNLMKNYLEQTSSDNSDIWKILDAQTDESFWEQFSECLSIFIIKNPNQKDSNYSPTIPFNLPSNQAVAIFHALGCNSQEISQLFSPIVSLDNVESEKNIDVSILAELGLCLGELDTLTRHKGTYAGMIGDNIGRILINQVKANDYIHNIGLDQKQLEVLVYNHLTPIQRHNEKEKKLLANLYINIDNTKNNKPPLELSTKDKDTDVEFINLTKENLLRMRQMLILSNKTGWDTITLDAALNALGITEIKQLKDLKGLAQLSAIARQFEIPFDQMIAVMQGLKKFNQLVATASDLKALHQDSLIAITPLLELFELTIEHFLVWIDYKKKIKTENDDVKFDIGFLVELVELKNQLDNVSSDFSTLFSVLWASESLRINTEDNDWLNNLSDKLHAEKEKYKKSDSEKIDSQLMHQIVHAISVKFNIEESVCGHFYQGLISNSLPGSSEKNQDYILSLYLDKKAEDLNRHLKLMLPYLIWLKAINADINFIRFVAQYLASSTSSEKIFH